MHDSCHLEQTEITSCYTRPLSRRPQSSHSAVWVQEETCSKHWEVGYASDTHDKDKSKWEITFNENLWRANKLILMLVHLPLLLCQSFKDSWRMPLRSCMQYDWSVLNFPLTRLSWMRLFPREQRQLGFTSPFYWNSFRGRRGRKTANSLSSFSLFPSSRSPHKEIYSLYCKCSQVKRHIQKAWAYSSTLSSAIAVLEAVHISYSLGKPKPSLRNRDAYMHDIG